MSNLELAVNCVRERMANAARRAGRDPDEITLVAVTKKQSVESVRDALALGLTELGENYVQEAQEKREHLRPSEIAAAHWHLLGHLQSNKARQAVHAFDLIQSVDSVKLAAALSRHAVELGKTQKILLQAHLGQETTKSGLPPEQIAEVAAETAALPGIALQGLMGIAPNGEDARPFFRQLRRLFEALPASSRHILSIGMTGDFETAIEEGATLVRIGTALFGARQ